MGSGGALCGGGAVLLMLLVSGAVLVIGGRALVLLKLGVIGYMWATGKEDRRASGSYRLSQSHAPETVTEPAATKDET